MAKYHITAKGDPGVCRATKSCPLGGENDHFDSKEAAREAFEERQETQALVDGLRKSPDFIEMKAVPKEHLMHPQQKAHRVGGFFVSSRPVPSIDAKGGVETLYETTVIDKNGDEVETWATRDPNPEVHKEQHVNALAFTHDFIKEKKPTLAERIALLREERITKAFADPTYNDLLAESNEIADEDDPMSAREKAFDKKVEGFAESHGIDYDDVMDMFGGSNWGK